jgi:hypothetical protein
MIFQFLKTKISLKLGLHLDFLEYVSSMLVGGCVIV